jgi:hypothetical protein
MTLKKGYYRSAGAPAQYNWVDDGHDIKGVGINCKILKQNTKIEVVINNQVYDLVCQDALDAVDSYDSIYKPTGYPTLEVCVFPADLLIGSKTGI